MLIPLLDLVDVLVVVLDGFTLDLVDFPFGLINLSVQRYEENAT